MKPWIKQGGLKWFAATLIATLLIATVIILATPSRAASNKLPIISAAKQNQTQLDRPVHRPHRTTTTTKPVTAAIVPKQSYRPSTASSVSSPPSTIPPQPVDLSGNRKLGHDMMIEAGFGEDQWACLDTLWGPLESGWNHYADNPHSSAYGIPQALPGSKMGPGWESDPVVQIRWGLGYIKSRYGTPCNAKAERLRKGWY